jgi:hypothetical protein
MLRKVLSYEMPDSLIVFMGSGSGGQTGGGSSSGQCSSNYGAYQSCTGLSNTNGCARGKGTDGSRKDGQKR